MCVLGDCRLNLLNLFRSHEYNEFIHIQGILQGIAPLSKFGDRRLVAGRIRRRKLALNLGRATLFVLEVHGGWFATLPLWLFPFRVQRWTLGCNFVEVGRGGVAQGLRICNGSV